MILKHVSIQVWMLTVQGQYKIKVKMIITLEVDHMEDKEEDVIISQLISPIVFPQHNLQSLIQMD